MTETLSGNYQTGLNPGRLYEYAAAEQTLELQKLLTF